MARGRGITLLEILFACSLLSVAIIAFATVFPSGYRLNLANINQNQAASIANTVAEEIRSLDVNSVTQGLPLLAGYDTATGKYDLPQMSTQNILKLKILDKLTGQTLGPLVPLPTNLAFQKATAGQIFYLPDGTNNTPQGIQVAATVDNTGPEAQLVPPLTSFQIVVTVMWQETRKNTVLTRNVSVTTSTSNAFFPVVSNQ
jgi:type II secretory pathway pseudopilin PulG